jgi:hypothetical protein
MAILEDLGQPADSKRIVSLHYARRHRPIHAQKSVVSVLNRLVRKTRRSQIRVKKTRRRGPYPISFYLEET